MTLTRERPQEWVLDTRDGPVTIYAVRLGHGTSRSDVHSHITDVAERGRKCSACRWSEVQIFKTLLGDYVIHTAGHSAVPGEFTKTRLVRTAVPQAVIDALVVERFEAGELKDTFITRPAQDALDDATDLDVPLADALDEWADDPDNARLLD